MAKRNSSDSAGRRGSARSGAGKSFSGRKGGTAKPFTKRESSSDSEKKDSRSSGKPDRKFSKPFGTTSDRRRSNSFEDSERKSSKPDDGFADKKRRSSSSDRFNNSSARSSKKFDKPFSKSGDKKDKGQFERFAKKPFKSSSPRDKDEDPGEKKARGFFNPTARYSSGPQKFKSRKPSEEESVHKDSDIIRLNKYISNSGVCSRREADEYIKMGLVSVNGNVITELGYKVKRTDEVRYEDKVLKAEKPVYILMNKPKGFITTTKDPEERKTIMHIIGSAVKERVYPVGRLDRNTTGLLLLTNDGDLADKLMHPSYNAKKIYKVELDRPLTKADFQKIRDGVHLEEGRALVDDVAIISEDNKTIGIEIHIGWNRVVRRIFESLLYTVEKLDRTVYAGLDKKDLPRGAWRFLTKEEIVLLKHYK